jgi:hypothetical protein
MIMPLNPYMNSPDTGMTAEQELLQDLVDDNIAAGGVEVYYMQKEVYNFDEVFRESSLSSFKSGFAIEMMITNIVGFNGDGDLFSKFGMTYNDQATLTVSSRRFQVEGSKYGMSAPKEEDLLYMPMTKSFWQIRKVKRDENYYQFGQVYTWRLEVDLYTPNHEEFFDKEVSSEDLGMTIQQVDELFLGKIFGIDNQSSLDQGEALREDSNQSLSGGAFDPNNPFGDM